MKLSKELRDVSGEGVAIENNMIKYKVSAEIVTLDNCEMLKVDFLANKNHFKSLWNQPPAKHFRLLADKSHRDLVWLYTDNQGNMHRRTCKMREFLHYTDYIEISEKDEKILMKYLGVKKDLNHGLEALSQLTIEITEEKTAAIRKQRGLFNEEEISLFSDEIPEEVLKWVKRKIAQNEKTIIYKKGNISGLCYYCGCKVKAAHKRFKQYEFVTCPNCGEEVTCYLANGAAEKAHTVDNFIVPSKNGDVFLMRGFRLRRDPSAQYENIQNWIEEKERFAIRGKNLGRWVKSSYGWDMVSNSYRGYYSKVYLNDFDEVKKGTSLQYAEQSFIDKGMSFVSWADSWARYPIIELLKKAGYKKIAYSIEGSPKRYDELNPFAKNLIEFFKVPLGILRGIAPAEELTASNMQKIQRLYALGYDAEKIKMIISAGISTDRIRDITKYSSVKKVCRYIIKQDSLRKEKYKGAASDYIDYLHQLELLGEDTTDKAILFPENLELAHREMNEKVRLHQDKIAKARKKMQDKEFAEKMKEYTYLNFEDKKAGLIAVVPSSASQLTAEGKALHHCVGSYIDRVLSGVTLILFIRKSDSPKESFYTLEYKNDKIVQCRTKCNKDYRENPEVTAFVNKWLKYVNKIKNQKERKTA